MNNFTVKSLLKEGPNSQKVFIEGWVKTFRANRFISLNDGSCSESIQCVVDFQNTNSKILSKINTGTSVKIEGLLVESQGKGQKSEIKVGKITILGECDMDSYPIQPKKHSLQFLRENAHLRVRTNTFSSIMRVRSNLSFAIHKYFKEKGFFYVNTPIITGSDAEGAGEMFKVTTLEINKDSLNQKNEVNYDEDFFGKETNLTVSGQLEAESLAMGLGKVYTFGPTFRAENSNTSRHLAEFWMIEPEMAFYDLEDNMELAEDFIKYIIKDLINECKEDLEFLNQRLIDEDKSKPINERNELSLLDRLDFVIKNNFKRITYSEAFEILKNSKPNKKKKFKFPILEWGVDFQSEHERYLVEKHFK
ncbi:MAG: asparagine--tRNA ligase, partial [Pelagibacterales bacterium]|nr:asparagine--tRNA ligase [Pelagibacterales bacterium]